VARKFCIKIFDPELCLAAILLLIVQKSVLGLLLIGHDALFNWRLILGRKEIFTKAEVVGLGQG